MKRAGQPGPHNAITDVAGIRVGHHTRIGNGALTGTTVLLLPPGSVAAVDVRGGAPATRDTAALDVRQAGLQAIDVPAVVLTGGSAYGLAAAHGVLGWLAEQGLGAGIPVVPAAALFDLGRGGDFHARPDAEFGRQAAASATDGPVEQGNVGAGAGAVTAGVKGGLGTASEILPDGTVLAAIAAVNARGASIDPDSGLPHAWRAGLPGEFPLTPPGPDERAAAARILADSVAERTGHRPLNTVIGAVATNALLSPPQAAQLARAAHDGLSLAAHPAHTIGDGDSIFAVGTGQRSTVDFATVLAAASSVFARAMVHGVLAAESIGTDWGPIVGYRDLYPHVMMGAGG